MLPRGFSARCLWPLSLSYTFAELEKKRMVTWESDVRVCSSLQGTRGSGGRDRLHEESRGGFTACPRPKLQQCDACTRTLLIVNVHGGVLKAGDIVLRLNPASVPPFSGISKELKIKFVIILYGCVILYNT